LNAAYICQIEIFANNRNLIHDVGFKIFFRITASSYYLYIGSFDSLLIVGKINILKGWVYPMLLPLYIISAFDFSRFVWIFGHIL